MGWCHTAGPHTSAFGLSYTISRFPCSFLLPSPELFTQQLLSTEHPHDDFPLFGRYGMAVSQVFPIEDPFQQGTDAAYLMIKKYKVAFVIPLTPPCPINSLLMNNGPSFSFPTGPSPDNDVNMAEATTPLPETPGLIWGNTFIIKVFEKLLLIS